MKKENPISESEIREAVTEMAIYSRSELENISLFYQCEPKNRQARIFVIAAERERRTRA